MYDLDEILDEVRTKYYCSKNLKRPSIVWSKDYWTDFFGVYSAFDNSITISRILDDESVSHDMIASVVYHENLHQDYPEHNRGFNAKANLFPNYSDYYERLKEYGAQVHSNIEYPSDYNCFTKGKKQIVYILLPLGERFSEALASRDGKILLDFDASISFSINCEKNDILYVFFAESNGQCWIVGWSTEANLLKKRQFDRFSLYGDDDVSYHLICEFSNIYLLPSSTCTYAIDMSDMNQEFRRNHCCLYQADETEIAEDLAYIDSYCEGYISLGFDPKLINNKTDYSDIPLERIKKIHESVYGEVWKCNVIIEKEPCYENFILRAKSKRNAWLPSSAMEDYVHALSFNEDDGFCAGEIIKLCAITSRLSEGTEYIESYKHVLNKEDKALQNAIDFILNH